MVSGTHVIDRMLDWFGQPSRITYADDSRGGVEANCKASLEFDNELGQFTGSFSFKDDCPEEQIRPSGKHLQCGIAARRTAPDHLAAQESSRNKNVHSSG